MALEICLVVVAPRRGSCGRLHLSFFLSEVRTLGLADATAFDRLPSLAGRHRPVRTPRSCLTRWLPSLAPLSSPDDYTRLLGVSRRSWYRIVAYPGDCFVGVLLLGTSSVFAGGMKCRLLGSMNSAECCDFDKKTDPMTSEGIIQVLVHARIVYYC